MTNLIISPAMLKTYEQCKKKFFLQYVRNIYMPKSETNFETGKNIHAIARYYLSGLDIKKFENSLSESELKLWKDLQNNEFFCKTPVKTEFQLNFKLKNLWFGGRIDAIVKEKNNYYILDYKTGNAPKDAKYDYQTMIYLLATSKYLDAVKFIMPLGFAAIAEFISGIVGNIVFYYEKTGFMSKATTVSALINVFLNFFGIKYFGFIAAGYTTAICGMIKLILYYIGAKKYEKNLAKIMDIKMIVIILFSYSILSVFGSFFINYFALRFGILALIVSVMIVYRNKIAGLIRKIRTTGEWNNEK